METIIFKWINNLIIGGDMPINLIDEDFHLEDGMSLIEYWEYEKNSFNEYSKIFDLDEKFSIQIIYHYEINDKNICHIYVLNKYNRIAFKMNISIRNNKISSNNFNSQIVPKYGILENNIKYIGMAIKAKYELENIISSDFEKEYFTTGANFDEDKFYSAKFIPLENIENKAYIFYLKYKGVSKPEKRIVFFDQFRNEDCPFIIEDNKLVIINEKYPVNLSAYDKNKGYINFVYPRNIELLLLDIEHIVVTDVLDNDWEIFIK